MTWINISLLLSVIAIYSDAEPVVKMYYTTYDNWCIVQCRGKDMPANSELLLSKMSPEDNSVYYFSDGHPEYEFFDGHVDGGTYLTVLLVYDNFQWEGEYMCIVREKTSDQTTWTADPEYIKYAIDTE
ncbi:uncharacterized protein [Mytilus edulis]|uniref:uncharacterized protein n=1 Tax=Mytilus edulis TaxID=6550 RepID=UPI0039F03E0F